MKKRKEFTPGQLVWITSRVTGWSQGCKQALKGYPDRFPLTAGVPCTVIRKALAKDYGIYGRHTYKGVSTAMKHARTAWLVLYEGTPAMIDSFWLVKRRYTPRKTRQQV